MRPRGQQHLTVTPLLMFVSAASHGECPTDTSTEVPLWHRHCSSLANWLIKSSPPPPIVLPAVAWVLTCRNKLVFCFSFDPAIICIQIHIWHSPKQIGSRMMTTYRDKAKRLPNHHHHCTISVVDESEALQFPSHCRYCSFQHASSVFTC